MKKKNIFLIAMISVIAITIIVQLSISISLRMDSSNMSPFDISTLANEIILKDEAYGSHSFYMSHREGGKGEFEDNYYEEMNYNIITIERVRATGVTLLSATETTDNFISYDISLNLKKGSLDLVVICDDKIIDRISCENGSNTFSLSYNEGKVYYVKAVASEAEFSFDFQRKLS